MGNMCVSQNSVKAKPSHPPTHHSADRHSDPHSSSHKDVSASNKENRGDHITEKSIEGKDHERQATPVKNHSIQKKGQSEFPRMNSMEKSIQRVADEFVDEIIFSKF